jgi:hypothetical protein
MHVTILGKRYELTFVPRLAKNTLGECEHPTEPGKKIRVKQGLVEKQTLDTLLHEQLHASVWSKEEEWIQTVASDITRIHWRLGYRKQKDKMDN